MRWSASLIFAATLLLGSSTRATVPTFEPYNSDPDTALLLHLDGNVEDASDDGRTVQATGVRWRTDGLMGGALVCDGRQAISVAPPPNLSNGFTVEAWVRLEPPAEPMQYGLLSWKGALELEFQVYPDNPMKPVFRIKTDKGETSFRAMAYVAYRRWVHIALTYDPAGGEGKIALLVHGEPVRHSLRSVPNAPGRLVRGEGRLRLAPGLVGAVDELRISTKPRRMAELRCPWPSGRSGDFEPFRADVMAPPAPEAWKPERVWLTAAQAVPTFNSLGLYVRYAHDVDRNGVCGIRYREKGEAEWRRGMDLIPAPEDGEFRGSLLGLRPDAEYEVELSAIDPDAKPAAAPEALRLTTHTWQESAPIGEVRSLPAGVSHEPLLIDGHGKPDAWILYAPPTGKASIIDAGMSAPNAVLIQNAAYVILQGITARGGTNHCMRVEDSHHVRIRRCEITGWGIAGTPGPDGRYVDEQGRIINRQAGVHVGMLSSQVVVEDNFIHTPRGTSRSWWFGHPTGPEGLLLSYAWNNVVRNNEIVGSEAHWWNDAIESQSNGTVTGGPYRDTDIHGNVLAFADDDGTELDGGQINVRYWHNRIEKTLCGISFAPCLKGPSYAFRNIIAKLGDELAKPGNAFKMGYGRPHRGLCIILHNTRFGRGGGPQDGDTGRNGADGYRCLVRNNLVARPGAYRAASAGPGSAAEAALPVFVAPQAGDYRLAPPSAAIDAGVPLAGFNDEFAGKGPDIGAHEHYPQPQPTIPYRRGMSVRPGYITLSAAAGADASAQGVAVELTIPPLAGARWSARPNSPWIRCRPSSAATSDASQTVTVSCDARALDIRLHRGAVVFRTDSGFNVTLMVDAQIRHRDHFVTVMEAEDGTLNGGMTRARDSSASGGAFVHALDESGTVTFGFDVPADGPYYVLGRCLAPAPSGSHDSFIYAMDLSPPFVWDVHAYSKGWCWDVLNQRNDENQRRSVDPWLFRLSQGHHTLTITARELGCRLDRIAISNSPYAP